jgi:protein gp37
VLALTQTGMTPYNLDAEAERENKQAICFVSSLSDFFHEDADRWRADAWQTINDCTHVNFMLLTKRPERIADCLPDGWGEGERFKNAWLGTTCGVRSSYERVEILQAIPSTLRFLSIEPLMESVADIPLSGIGWVAAGGMSGSLNKKHRMQMAWAAEVHDLCLSAGIPFLFKQSSNIFSERGINGLSLFLAEREGKNADPETVPLLRSYPPTDRPLLPFIEYGQRFTMEEFMEYQSPVKPSSRRVRENGSQNEAVSLSKAPCNQQHRLFE